jgi:hypothetical protein
MTKKNKQTKDKAKILAKKSIVPCQQKQCGLLHNGCPKCSECGAKPDMISEGCQTCFDCEYKPGAIRDGRDNSDTNKEIIKKMIEDKVKYIKNQKKAPRQLLMANGELSEEPDSLPEPFKPNSDNPLGMGGEEFAKELKAEIIRQMARDVLEGAKMDALKKIDTSSMKGSKGKCKDKGCNKCEEEPEEETGRQVPYIGYIC